MACIDLDCDVESLLGIKLKRAYQLVIVKRDVARRSKPWCMRLPSVFSIALSLVFYELSVRSLPIEW
jgi:hypothetical protein